MGRLPHDRVPRRRRRAPPEPQRAADEPLLPRGRGAGAGAPRPSAWCSTARWSWWWTASRSSTSSPSASTRPPRAWRCWRASTPAALVAFDLLAEGDETLLELPYDERRERLGGAGRRTRCSSPRWPPTATARAQWLEGNSRGRGGQGGRAPPTCPGERKGMVKIKRVRTADVVVAAFRFGKEEGTVGSLILGLYDDDGDLHVVGHTSGFKAREKRELRRAARALPHPRARLGRAEPVEVRRGARLGGAAARARVRDRLRPHHRATDPPRREVRALAQGQGPEPTATSRSCGARTRHEHSPCWPCCWSFPRGRGRTGRHELPDPARQPVRGPRGRARPRSTPTGCATPTASRSTARTATC